MTAFVFDFLNYFENTPRNNARVTDGLKLLRAVNVLRAGGIGLQELEDC